MVHPVQHPVLHSDSPGTPGKFISWTLNSKFPFVVAFLVLIFQGLLPSKKEALLWLTANLGTVFESSSTFKAN